MIQDYINHSLNRSPSKASFTFSKTQRFNAPPKKRFPVHEKEHIQPRDIMYGQHTSRSNSYNKSKLKSRSTKQIKRTGNSNNGKKSVGRYANYKNKRAGPNQYRHQYVSPKSNNRKSYSPSPQHRRTSPASRHPHISPAYQTHTSPTRHTRISPTHQTHISPSRNIITLKPVDRQQLDRSVFRRSKSKSPIHRNKTEEYYYGEPLGPGSYNVQQKTIGLYLDSRYKNIPGTIFPKQPRKYLQQPQKCEDLGPGQYHGHISEFSDRLF